MFVAEQLYCDSLPWILK